jgi:hypothetical protein
VTWPAKQPEMPRIRVRASIPAKSIKSRGHLFPRDIVPKDNAPRANYAGR